MTKPPTAPGISARLKRAGFTRGETYTTAVPGWHNYSTGFKVYKGDEAHEGTPGTVEVHYQIGGLRITDADREREQEMLGKYEAVLQRDGWAVTRRAGIRPGLIVAAKPEEQPHGE